MIIETAFMQFPVLTTRRLRLRQLQLDDAEAIFSMFSDEEVMKFYGHLPHQTLEDSRDLIRRIQVRYALREGIRWGITLDDEDNIIGTCSFHHFGADYHRAETGYELHRDYWGKGIMAEAVSAILDYGFTELRLHRVEAIIDIANKRSKALLQKLGFAYEGALRQRYYIDGRFEDEHYFGLLKHEWRRPI